MAQGRGNASERPTMSQATTSYHHADPSTWKFGSASKEGRLTSIKVSSADGGYIRVQLAKDLEDQSRVLLMQSADFEKTGERAGEYKMVTSISTEEEEWWKRVKARIAKELVVHGDTWLGRRVTADEAESLIVVPAHTHEQYGPQKALKVTPKSKCYQFHPRFWAATFEKDKVARGYKVMPVVSMSKIYISDGVVRLPAYVDRMMVDASAVPQQPTAFQM